ncbi:NAD(+) synthase [Anaerosporobacter faecicola]|uniref:NAD(+) synthase n=1 Tax=Anaerosporobacter faecicola TaxID=2718714 RepID=UPI00143AA03C|nr:NAD(+) synthase [Anaerosporobacter faecicola]
MKHGFVKVAAATPMVKVADPTYNTQQIVELIHKAAEEKVRVLVFPELCITGYTCGDLFLQNTLLSEAKESLVKIIRETKNRNMVVVVGLPIMKLGNLYNTAAVIFEGQLLGIVPKVNIPNYSEFYEARYFGIGNEKVEYIDIIDEKEIPFGANLLFRCNELQDFIISVEICEDLWVPIPPSSRHALAGATVIVNPSASNETTGKDIYRKDLVCAQSASIMGAYIYASAGEGESTSDVVFSGHNLIAENGTILKEAPRFTNDLTISEIDIQKLVSERRRMSTFCTNNDENYTFVDFTFTDHALKDQLETTLTRTFAKTPFVPSAKDKRDKRCEEILNIQAFGLKKRLMHIGCKNAVVGISGGLDSTLALLVMVKAYDLLGLDRSNIIAVTMPCFGTTDRTYNNAVTLTRKLGATLREIPIREAVLLHLKDIGHDVNNHDVTYENAQARERTQILMNVANQSNGIVVGTGDMSELALGWATYNGDHMSMYGVNCSVPKTLVRYLVAYYADTLKDQELRDILLDVLDTPVSPELLPPEDGKISQKTEDLVGPYELHDFFLYYVMRFGFTPGKVFRLAKNAFAGDYEDVVIYKWLRTFYWRFFTQQFKRNCLPDGPKVGSVAVSPRGDLRMPSDASSAVWMKELDEIKQEYGLTI